jgi:hypothetical protein
MWSIWLERLARGKRSSLLRKFVNYDRKKFYNTDCQMLMEEKNQRMRMETALQVNP